MEYMAISKPLNTSVPKPNTETVNKTSIIILLIKKKKNSKKYVSIFMF